MRSWFAIFCLMLSTVAVAQHASHEVVSPAATHLETGLGKVRFSISTEKKEAFDFFAQGLAYIYGFNHEAAIRSFKRAAEIDPELAMAHWGIAYALGPNINAEMSPEQHAQAFKHLTQAMKLAKKATARERGYIKALAARYSSDSKASMPPLAVHFAKSMKNLVASYPDDLDATTLYAESLMDLRPWDLWKNDGTPQEGTLEIVSLLESVLRRDPQHLGANHYYIHATEASREPHRALASANRLAALAPESGHLVHMPSHVYIRTGDYASASESNARALEVDRRYIKAYGNAGFYQTMYYNHNFHFLSAAAAMEGRLIDARKAADTMRVNLLPMAKEMPMLDGVTVYPTLLLVRFAKWKEILALDEHSTGAQSEALIRFSRGVAFAALGRVADALAEQSRFRVSKAKVPSDAAYMLNKASVILSIADQVLAGRIAVAKGEAGVAESQYRSAIALEDEIRYDEPSDWFYPVRETLGAFLLTQKKHTDAETIFREDLERNPRNGRSLFGLMKALEGQEKNEAAALIRAQYAEAWQRADAPLQLADF